MIWFTADTHYGDKKIIHYMNRPFKSVEEMNNTLIENWNKKVGERDLVYHLGDFGFGDPDPILSKLKGFKKLVIGSHDRDAAKSDIWVAKDTRMDIWELNIPITLSHYCMRVWPKSHYNSYMLYGHSHGFLKSQGKSHDVGVDCNNFTPLSFLEVAALMEKKPDNFNLVKRMRTPTDIKEEDDNFTPGDENVENIQGPKNGQTPSGN